MVITIHMYSCMFLWVYLAILRNTSWAESILFIASGAIVNPRVFSASSTENLVSGGSRCTYDLRSVTKCLIGLNVKRTRDLKLHEIIFIVYPKDRLVSPLSANVTISYPTFFFLSFMVWVRVGVGRSITPRG